MNIKIKGAEAKRMILRASFSLMLACLASTIVNGKGIVTKTYVFGFAASFNDSIVHFTDIQAIDSAWVDTKSKFLLGRENYSYQLRDHLATHADMPYRTCVVVYDTSLPKLEKELLKMKRLYTEKQAKDKFDVRQIPVSEFKFDAVNVGADEETADDNPKPEKKKKHKKKH